MGLWDSYRMRLQRKRWRVRAMRKRRSLTSLSNKTRDIRPGDVLLFSTFRNEHLRMPYFLKYYRGIGINHFLMVDNGSTDGGAEYLIDQPTTIAITLARMNVKRLVKKL